MNYGSVEKVILGILKAVLNKSETILTFLSLTRYLPQRTRELTEKEI